jgi:hypothetical protein
MKKVFCTIITLDHIHYAISLYQSLANFEKINFITLIVDEKNDFNLYQKISEDFRLSDDFKIMFAEEICVEGIGQIIFQKYSEKDTDCLRWSLKSVLMMHLLDRGYDQVFFLDPDLYFFSPFDFLYTELSNSSLLLTPHWRCSDPYLDKGNFMCLQTSGLFNAGFIGATILGYDALSWWAKVCAYECKKAPNQGLFDDQAYLDLMFVYFDYIKVLKHRGCNVANWNQIECKRLMDKEGHVSIEGKYEIVFIHFTKSTIDGIRKGQDFMLQKHLGKYLHELNKNHKLLPDFLFTKKTTSTLKSNNQVILTAKLMVKKIKIEFIRVLKYVKRIYKTTFISLVS